MALAQLLVEQNFPAIAIHRAMTQEERYFDFVLTISMHSHTVLDIIYYVTIPDYLVGI